MTTVFENKLKLNLKILKQLKITSNQGFKNMSWKPVLAYILKQSAGMMESSLVMWIRIRTDTSWIRIHVLYRI